MTAIAADMDDEDLAAPKLPRSRGAVGGVLLILLGAWAGLVPFIGPYFQFGYTPSTDTTWKWTAARGYLEVAPGAVVVLAGFVLLFSRSRLVMCLVASFAAIGGAWLIIATPLAPLLHVQIGQPDPTWSLDVRIDELLAYFYVAGAVILLVASVTLGRLSVQSVKDAQAAQPPAETPAEPAPAWTDDQSFSGASAVAPGADMSFVP